MRKPPKTSAKAKEVTRQCERCGATFKTRYPGILGILYCSAECRSAALLPKPQMDLEKCK